MGQRTAILLKKNFGNNRSTITLIHHQWGIGKTMPAYLMQEILKYSYPLDRSLSYFSLGELEEKKKLPIDYFFTFEPLNNKNNNYITNKEVATDDPDEDIWRSDVRIRYGNMTDNNNGLMLVEVTQKFDEKGEPETYSDMLSIKVGFALGSEEIHFRDNHMEECIHIEPEFDRLVSMEEFATRTFDSNRPQVMKYTKKFIKACKTVMELADVEEVYDKEGAKKRIEREEHIKNCIEGLTKGLGERETIPVPPEFKGEVSLYA
jgi:hypothetical protein